MMYISIIYLKAVLGACHIRLSDGFVRSWAFGLKYFFTLLIFSIIFGFSVILSDLQLFPYSLATFILGDQLTIPSITSDVSIWLPKSFYSIQIVMKSVCSSPTTQIIIWYYLLFLVIASFSIPHITFVAVLA